MRLSDIEGARVSQPCKSAESKSILTLKRNGFKGKGNRLIFLYHLDTCGNTSLFTDVFG